MISKHIPKVLFVGFNRQYVNRNIAVLMRAVQANHELDFFGPGYVKDSELKAGAEKWIDSHGEYDLILFESYSLENDAIIKRPKPFAGDYINFKKEDFYFYGPKLQAFIQEYSGKKIFLSNFDIYGIDQRRIDQIEKLNCFVLCAPSRTSLKQLLERFPQAEPYNYKGFLAGHGNDNWYNFVKRNKDKVLEIPAGIGLEQISYTPLSNRTRFFTVPGAGYSERKQVYSLMTVSQRLNNHLHRLGDRLYGMRKDSLTHQKIKQINHRYDSDISDSCFAYVSGSIFRRSVRKYFEVPALGATPVGQECDGFTELGFKDHLNFLIAETPGDVQEIIRNLPISEAQEIASNARRHIINSHSEPARARQLAQSFSMIIDGSFNGSYWDNGVYSHY